MLGQRDFKLVYHNTRLSSSSSLGRLTFYFWCEEGETRGTLGSDLVHRPPGNLCLLCFSLPHSSLFATFSLGPPMGKLTPTSISTAVWDQWIWTCILLCSISYVNCLLYPFRFSKICQSLCSDVTTSNPSLSSLLIRLFFFCTAVLYLKITGISMESLEQWQVCCLFCPPDLQLTSQVLLLGIPGDYQLIMHPFFLILKQLKTKIIAFHLEKVATFKQKKIRHYPFQKRNQD